MHAQGPSPGGPGWFGAWFRTWLLGGGWTLPALLALWAAQLVLIFADPPLLRDAATALMALYLIDKVLRGRIETRLIWGVTGVIAAAVLFTYGGFEAIPGGVAYAMLFAAMLPTLQLSRAVARHNAGVRESQRRLTRASAGQNTAGYTLGSFIFGAVLNTGAFAIVASTQPAGLSEPERRENAMAALRGNNLAVLWSPFFVAMGFISYYLPGVPYWQVLVCGLFLSLVGLGLSLVMFSRPVGAGALASALQGLVPVCGFLGVAGAAVIGVSSLTPLTTLEAVIVVIPVLCIVELALAPDRILPVVRELRTSLDRLGDDIGVIAAGMVLSQVMAVSPALGRLLEPVVALGLPTWAFLSLVLVVTMALGVFGIHPIIPATLILVAANQMDLPVRDLVLMMTMLIGWSIGSMVSLSALSPVIAASMFEVRPLRILISRNILYLIIFSGVCVVLLSIFDAMSG